MTGRKKALKILHAWGSKPRGMGNEPSCKRVLPSKKYKKQSFSESQTLLKEVIFEDPLIGLELIEDQERFGSKVKKIWTPYEMLTRLSDKDRTRRT